jgi:hypothetical protein
MSPENSPNATRIKFEITVPAGEDPGSVVGHIFGSTHPDGIAGTTPSHSAMTPTFRAMLEGAQNTPPHPSTLPAAIRHTPVNWRDIYDPYGGLPSATVLHDSLGYKIKGAISKHPLRAVAALGVSVLTIGLGGYAFTRGVGVSENQAAAIAEYKPVNLKTMLSAATIANGKPFAIAGVGAKGTETVYYVNKDGKPVPIEPDGENLTFDYRQGIPLVLAAASEKDIFTISEQEGKTKVVIDLGKFTVGAQEEQYENNKQEPDGTVDGFTANRLVNPPVSESKALNSGEAKQVNALVTYPNENLKLQLEKIGVFKDASGNELKVSDMSDEQKAAIMYESALMAQLQYNQLGQIQDRKCDGSDSLQSFAESSAMNAVIDTVRQSGGDPSSVDVSFEGTPKLEGLVDREAESNRTLAQVPKVVDVRMRPADGTDYKCVITGVKQ